MTRALILIALLLSGCGESVSERSANEKRDYAIESYRREQSTDMSAEQRLRSLEDRVTALEGAK